MWKMGRSEGQYFVFRVVQMVWITEMLLWGLCNSWQENKLVKTWKLQKEMVLRRYKGVNGHNGQYWRGLVLVERCVRYVTESEWSQNSFLVSKNGPKLLRYIGILPSLHMLFGIPKSQSPKFTCVFWDFLFFTLFLNFFVLYPKNTYVFWDPKSQIPKNTFQNCLYI